MLGNRKGYNTRSSVKGRNAGKRNSGNGRHKEHGTHKERDEYSGYKLSRREQKRMKKVKRRRKLIAILAVEFLLILVLGVGVFALSKLDKFQDLDVNPDDISMNEDIDEDTVELLKGYTNIALFGLGSRTPGSLGKGELSDTIIIASINNETKEVRLMSIYRDTYHQPGGRHLRKMQRGLFQGRPQAGHGDAQYQPGFEHQVLCEH